MLVMVVFFIAFRWIHLSTPLIRLFLLVLILLLMPTLNFLPVWFALSLLRFRDRKSGSAGMPRPISYAVFCLKKKNSGETLGASSRRRTAAPRDRPRATRRPSAGRGPPHH